MEIVHVIYICIESFNFCHALTPSQNYNQMLKPDDLPQGFTLVGSQVQRVLIFDMANFALTIYELPEKSFW